MVSLLLFKHVVLPRHPRAHVSVLPLLATWAELAKQEQTRLDLNLALLSNADHSQVKMQRSSESNQYLKEATKM